MNDKKSDFWDLTRAGKKLYLLLGNSEAIHSKAIYEYATEKFAEANCIDLIDVIKEHKAVTFGSIPKVVVTREGGCLLAWEDMGELLTISIPHLTVQWSDSDKPLPWYPCHVKTEERKEKENSQGASIYKSAVADMEKSWDRALNAAHEKIKNEFARYASESAYDGNLTLETFVREQLEGKTDCTLKLINQWKKVDANWKEKFGSFSAFTQRYEKQNTAVKRGSPQDGPLHVLCHYATPRELCWHAGRRIEVRPGYADMYRVNPVEFNAVAKRNEELQEAALRELRRLSHCVFREWPTCSVSGEPVALTLRPFDFKTTSVVHGALICRHCNKDYQP